MNKLGCMTDFWLFNQLNPDEKRQVQALTRKYTYARGEFLFIEGDPATFVFLIVEGRAKLSKVSENGKEIILGFLSPHNLFGEELLFTDTVRTMSAQAMDRVRICACEKHDFERLVGSNTGMAMKVVQTLGKKVHQLTEQLADLAMYDVQQRVARLLARLAREYGQETHQGLRLNLRLTHAEVGAMVGASRVMVSNVLQELRQAGYVSTDGHQRFVINPALLATTETGIEAEEGTITPPLCPCFEVKPM